MLFINQYNVRGDFEEGQVFGTPPWRGQNFSAPESENSTTPLVAVNNDHSLIMIIAV